jgi:cytochrome P450
VEEFTPDRGRSSASAPTGRNPAACPVPAGASRAVVFAAANRDPSVFKNPNTFDVTRAPNPHLAFSAGTHYCLGAPLARLHAEVALPLLFSRLPRLHALGDPEWLGGVPIRQIGRLNVGW